MRERRGRLIRWVLNDSVRPQADADHPPRLVVERKLPALEPATLPSDEAGKRIRSVTAPPRPGYHAAAVSEKTLLSTPRAAFFQTGDQGFEP